MSCSMWCGCTWGRTTLRTSERGAPGGGEGVDGSSGRQKKGEAGLKGGNKEGGLG